MTQEEFTKAVQVLFPHVKSEDVFAAPGFAGWQVDLSASVLIYWRPSLHHNGWIVCSTNLMARAKTPAAAFAEFERNLAAVKESIAQVAAEISQMKTAAAGSTEGAPNEAE